MSLSSLRHRLTPALHLGSRALSQARIWSLRHPRLATLVWGLVGCLPLFLGLDAWLSQAVRLKLSGDLRGFFSTITDIGLGGPWYIGFAAGWLICMATAGLSLTTEAHELWRIRARSWGFALMSLAASGIAVQALKFLFGRARPKFYFNEGVYGFFPFSGHNSFPSGHSQAIVGAMTALWFVYPRFRPAYVVIGATIAFSRVAVGAHYLSDTIMGSLLAIVVCLWVRDRYRDNGRPDVTLP
ncbi:phosphatase PAP2 family protein [Novispirillum itersonii]|uniref:phosphatase PAP2 family protein n=1 Tax=Novispirillum itersonii TaxID=189 RepID=UPI0003A0BDE4|nr:phosphatase PAP2 family protein [Novispirillum itersonii]